MKLYFVRNINIHYGDESITSFLTLEGAKEHAKVVLAQNLELDEKYNVVVVASFLGGDICEGEVVSSSRFPK